MQVRLGIGAFMLGFLGSSYAQADLEFYGSAQLDYIQDFKRVDPAWNDSLRPSKIPTQPDQFGSDGQAILSARQSRFGVNGNFPISGNDLKTKIEFDFYGVGVDEGKTTPRLKYAYGEYKEWLGGRANSLFMDIDVFPNIVDFMGPNGMAFTRRPQIRYTQMSGPGSFAIALENPGTDLDPALGGVSSDSKYPDLTAQFRTAGDWGHVQAAGVLRYLGFDTPGAAGANPKDNQMGWGINLTSNFKIMKADRLILAAVYGNGIASYMNDGGTDLAPDGPPGNLDAQAVPLYGVVAYYDYAWDDLWTSSIGYSRTEVTNTDFQAANAFHYGEYGSINALYAPQKNILTGAEFLYGTRYDKNGDHGEDYRLQFTMKYSFSNKN